jgi:hypothetical protein
MKNLIPVISWIAATINCLSEIDALKSPFGKVDLEGFSGPCEIPPAPL